VVNEVKTESWGRLGEEVIPISPKVLVTRKLLSEVLAYLEEYALVEGGRNTGGLTRKELKQKIRDKDGLFCLLVDRIDREVISAGGRFERGGA
jgi:hypothetical protein